MKPLQLCVAVYTALLMLGVAPAHAGKVLEQAGIIVCAMDKWNESEPAKGHKLAEAASRCVLIHDDTPASKTTEECVGNYEYLPDGSWKAAGTCVDTDHSGDKLHLTWEEGSHLKAYVYKMTGGTGKYEGAGGEGTYMYDSLTKTLTAGTFKGTMELP